MVSKREGSSMVSAAMYQGASFFSISEIVAEDRVNAEEAGERESHVHNVGM